MKQESNILHFTKAPIVETTGVTKVFKIGRQMVTPVSDVSLQIGYGDFVVIFGPSGAGKSTLLNILMGMEKPDLGQVFLKGESLYDFSNEDRAKIRLKRFGLIPQNQYWLEQINILENIALPLILQGIGVREATKKAKSLLELVGLSDHSHHIPSELSGGQKQKASIARALINDPWLVFADEPTGHLDTKSTEEVVNILLKTNREKKITIIMVTHDLEFLKYSKKWFFVKDGRLWDIKDFNNPFHNIKEAIGYVDSMEVKK